MISKGIKKIGAIILIAVVVIGLSCPAQAEETDPSGSKLRAFIEEYLKNPPANDGLANKINNAGGANAMGINEWLCSLEVACTLSIGYDIWESRMRADSYYMDHFTQSQFIPLNITNYCIIYSNSCDHWSWDPDCIKTKYKK